MFNIVFDNKVPEVGRGLPLLEYSMPAKTLILDCWSSVNLSNPPFGSSVIIKGW